MKRLFLLILVAATVFSVAAQNRSRVTTESIHSNVLNADRSYTIYLPKSYDAEPARKYPILYLLHGLTDTNTKWFERGHAGDVEDILSRNGEACEMIIVSPCAGGPIESDVWNGYFDMPGWKYETFFFTEFLPYIEKTYRVIGDKGHRAIAGLSMGGGGSTSYAQRHPDMFSSVYAMSAWLDETSRLSDGQDKLSILRRTVHEYDCVKYVEQATEAQKAQMRTVKWFFDCGDDDGLIDLSFNLTKAMRKADINCEFRVRDGSHNWEYWNAALYICLPFVSRNFDK